MKWETPRLVPLGNADGSESKRDYFPTKQTRQSGAFSVGPAGPNS